MSLFEFGFGRSAGVRKAIETLDLTPYVKKAVELFSLDATDITDAMREYRHFLYLMYWNKRLEGDHPMVPTKLADKLWHAHILFTRDYVAMCQKIFGTYMHHQPGLDEGTAAHTNAMKYTRELHQYVYRERRRPGFDEDYFSFVDPKPTPRQQQASRSRASSSSRQRRRDSDDGDSSTIFAEHDSHVPAHADSDFSGHGGSFGGAGASGGWGSDSSHGSSSSSSDHGSSSSSSDSSSGSSCGGGGCGGGGD